MSAAVVLQAIEESSPRICTIITYHLHTAQETVFVQLPIANQPGGCRVTFQQYEDMLRLLEWGRDRQRLRGHTRPARCARTGGMLVRGQTAY